MVKKIYVFDMGPERFQIKSSSIGGRLSDYDQSYKDDPHVNEYSYSIIPPRSASKNDTEVYENLLKEMRKVEEWDYVTREIDIRLVKIKN